MILFQLTLPLAQADQEFGTGGLILRICLLLFLLAGSVLVIKEWFDKRRHAADTERAITSGEDLVARFGNLALYCDPPRLDVFVARESDYGSPMPSELVTVDITPDVKAGVESTGNVSVTRGRNLAAKALGGAVVPGGVFIFGNAKEKAHDYRELYLVVEAAKWAQTWPLDPIWGADARAFAQQINVLAKSDVSRYWQERDDEELGSRGEREQDAGVQLDDRDSRDVGGRLAQLDRLKETGALSDEEYASQRQRILDAI